jgi:Carboxypeptidase regulatory-like domain/TonB-dependent Receptor Plug Domain
MTTMNGCVMLQSRYARLFLFFLLLVPQAALSQTSATGALMGTVTDTSGAAVANARVTTTSPSGQSQTVQTSEDGSYKFVLLPPGDYKLKVEAPGFTTLLIPVATVNVTETEVLNPSLAVGAQTEQITVQGNVESVQSATSTLGTVIGAQTVVDLPLSTRNFTNLLGYSAGANSNVNNATVLGEGADQIAVNGAATTQNNFLQDGVSVVDMAGSNDFGDHLGEIPIPDPDSIQEFKIQTAGYDASYGRNAGSNVNLVTKSGTDEFHGTAFEFFRNTALNANDWFLKHTQLEEGRPNIPGALNQNQYGGVFGGPVKRDKLFFFVSYQYTGQKNGFTQQGDSTGIGLPPLPLGNRGTCPLGVTTIAEIDSQCDAATQGFVATLGAAVCPSNYNPQGSGVPGAGENVPLHGGVNLNCSGNNINPQALQILQLKLPNGNYYVPASGTSQYVTGLSISDPAIFHEYQGMGNWDYIINKKNTLSGRYFFLTSPTTDPFVAGYNGYLSGTPQSLSIGNQVAILKLTTILTNNLVNELRGSFVRNTSNLVEPEVFSAPQVGITGINPGGPYDYMPDFTITGLFSGGINHRGDQSSVVNVFSWADNLAWTHGKHTVRTGFEYTHMHFKWLQPSYQWGGFTFDTFADFLIGLPGCVSASSAACSAGAAIAQAGGPGVLPASYSPLGTADNGTAYSNIDSIAAATDRTAPGGLLNYFITSYMSGFVQDDYKITRRLTLNLGLRWEFDHLDYNEYGYATNLWPNLIQRQPIPGSGCVYNGIEYGLGSSGTGCSFAGYEVPSNYSVGREGALPSGVYRNNSVYPTLRTPWDNFAPRFGFAWQPLPHNDRLVVRGGAGYFYDYIPGDYLAAPINQNPPYELSINLSGTQNYNASSIQPFVPTPLGWEPRWVNFANGTGSNYTPGGTQGPITPNLFTPVSYEYSLQTQYEFVPTWVLELGYVGSHGIHQETPTPINGALLASPTPGVNCGYDGVGTDCITTNAISGFASPTDRVPYLGFSPTFVVAASSGSYKYNSLQVTVRKSMSHGLTLQGAYTWSRAFATSFIGNPSDSLTENVPVIEEYGPNPSYHPNRFVFNYTWLLPYAHRDNWTGKALEGWSVSGVTVIQDGTPLTITDSRGGSVFGSPVASNAQLSGTGNILSPGSTQRRIDGYFNAAAFTTVPLASATTVPGCTCAGTLYGNSGLGVALGPGQSNWDISLAKLTRVGGLNEKATLEFRTEFFNAFNHPQFSNPATAYNSAASFGLITSTSVNPRLIQFGLKYRF